MFRFRPGATVTVLALPAAFAIAACEEAPPTMTAGVRYGQGAIAQTARVATVELDARETICVFTPGEQRIVNGVLHFSGFRAQTLIESNDPRYTGESNVEFRGQRDAAGNGNGFGRFTIRPATIDGTWEGKFSGRWTAGLFRGTSVAHGTGALRGQVLHIELHEILADPAITPCTPAAGTQFVETVRIHAAPGLSK